MLKLSGTALRNFACGAAIALGLACASAPTPLVAQVTAFKQAVAERISDDPGLAAFYRDRGFAPLWTGPDDSHLARRVALMSALSRAEVHGLPAGRYDVPRLMDQLRTARTERARGAAEIALSRAYLAYAHDIGTGLLEPGRVDRDIKREVPRRDSKALLDLIEQERPREALRRLAPQSPEYARLLREKMRLQSQMARGDWGATVPQGKYEVGQSGAGVVALRNRLIAMGYLPATSEAVFTRRMREAVQAFQIDHGLAVDGVAGGNTLSEINVSAADRLKSVMVALERERWINMPDGLGARHIRVNLTEFTARIVDDGKVTFETRSVIGAQGADRQTPEFSDVMDHMVINPSWYVPRSIIVKEYLPMLRRNPYSVGHLEITDSRGRRVNRGRGFSQYSASSFPFSMRQPPGPRNALGRVKFMFPNRYNIYLHDTPAKSLFQRNVRAYSHGCIRLNEPYEFAYAILARQESDPEGFFQARLRTGAEARVNLDQPIPVHLTYRTAFTQAKGRIQYRDDIYDRDARIWSALESAGVALSAGRS